MSSSTNWIWNCWRQPRHFLRLRRAQLSLHFLKNLPNKPSLCRNTQSHVENGEEVSSNSTKDQSWKAEPETAVAAEMCPRTPGVPGAEQRCSYSSLLHHFGDLVYLSLQQEVWQAKIKCFPTGRARLQMVLGNQAFSSGGFCQISIGLLSEKASWKKLF